MMRNGATSKSLFGVDATVPVGESHKIVLTDDLIAEMMVRAGEMLKKKDS
jgi:hypothetical protein